MCLTIFKKSHQKKNNTTTVSTPSHKEIFISHCSDDTGIMDDLTKILDDLFHSNVTVFNSFSEKSGVTVGEKISNGLISNLSDSELMIAIITDSYERSLKCISEISSFWYSEKPVIPIIFNGKIGEKFIKDLFGFEISSIVVDQDSPSKCSEKLVQSIDSKGFPLANREKVKNVFKEFFEIARQSGTDRPFIGSDITYDSILRYCDSFGIKQLKNTTLDPETLISNLADVKQLYIISTTGANMISLLSSKYLTEALLKGIRVSVVLPNKLSDVCNDIAEIETPDQIEDNKLRLCNGFNDVMTNLQKCLNDAYKLSADSKIGSIKVYCAFTLLRQTITLAIKNDDTIWGWMSMTLPPLRTNDGTPSMELRGKVGEQSLANIVYQHAKAMIRVAVNRSCFHTLQPNTKTIKNFFLEKESAREFWQKKQDKASIAAIKRKAINRNILIEVAAQHPLDGDKPDIEFQKRLDFGINLYNQLSSENKQAYIYVPGSVHCYDGVQDPVSLSCAGKNYLLEKGIPEDHIFGEDMNDKYKGNLGVYNSADECYVASEIYKNGRFSDLYCVCSPNQMLRKQLFYLAFEVIPQFYTVPCESLAHNLIFELFETVPDVIYNDHTWQDENSINANRTRKDRMPK